MIARNQEMSVAFGMPKAAIELAAVAERILGVIGDRIGSACRAIPVAARPLR